MSTTGPQQRHITCNIFVRASYHEVKQNTEQQGYDLSRGTQKTFTIGIPATRSLCCTSVSLLHEYYIATKCDHTRHILTRVGCVGYSGIFWLWRILSVMTKAKRALPCEDPFYLCVISSLMSIWGPHAVHEGLSCYSAPKCFDLLRVLRVPYENEGMSKNPNSLLLKRRSMDWYAVYYWFSVGITIVRQFCDDRGDLLAYKPCMNFEGLHDRSNRQDNAADTTTEVTWLLNLCTSKTCGII